jgi:hypothetical protein
MAMPSNLILNLGGVQPVAAESKVAEAALTPVDKNTLKDGDVVFDKNGTRFTFRGLRAEGQVGARSPRLEEANGNIVIPGENIQLFRSSDQNISDAQIIASSEYKTWAANNANPLMTDQENLEYYKQCKL